jgi:hypothetical protein
VIHAFPPPFESVDVAVEDAVSGTVDVEKKNSRSISSIDFFE